MEPQSASFIHIILVNICISLNLSAVSHVLVLFSDSFVSAAPDDETVCCPLSWDIHSLRLMVEDVS